MSLNQLLVKASGISADLDVTLSSLAESVQAVDDAMKDEIIEHLRDRIEELQESLDEALIYYGNKNVTNTEIDETKASIRNQLYGRPDQIQWFINNYTKNFLAGIEAPVIRLALCSELIRFCHNQKIRQVPDIWQSVVQNNGLIKE